MPGKGVSSALRKHVWLAAHRSCAACRRKITLAAMHCDHILPVEKGGTDHLRNLRCLCVACHKFRHGWTGQVPYRRLLKSGWEVRGTARYIVPRDRVLSYLKIKPPHQPKSLLSCVSYERQLECGCRVWVLAGSVFGVPRPRRLSGNILPCSAHSSLSDREWCQLPSVRFHPRSRTLPRSWFHCATYQRIR